MRFEMPPATDTTEGGAPAAGVGRPPMTAVFRCDADPAIGAGHVVRCLAIATRLAALGWRCTFAVGPDTQATVPALGRAGFPVVALPPEQDGELRALSAIPADLLVLDHYGRDARFESACRSAFGRILALDDAPGRPHDCDLLLDATPGRTPADYAGLVPARAGLLCGPAFAALRPDFVRHRPAALARRTGRVDRVLVAIGGSDAGGATARAATAVRRALPEVRIDVVTGGAAPALSEIRSAVAAVGGTLHVDTDAMADLIATADLAIGAPGGSSWERCALGLPALLFTVADNQRANAAALAAAGAADDLGPPDGWSVDRLAERVALARDPQRLRGMSAAAAALTDGNGALRTAMALAGTVSAGYETVALRPATAEDAATILGWQREPDARSFARRAAVPTEAEHAAWMAGRLAATDRVTAIVERAGRPAGLLRLDPHAGGLEVSILIAAAAQGRGVGKAALTLAQRLAPGLDLLAEVLPGNDRSRVLFRAAGYAEAGGNWLVARAPR